MTCGRAVNERLIPSRPLNVTFHKHCTLSCFFLTKSTWKSGRAMKYTFSVHSVTLREKLDLLRYLDLLFSQYKPDDISSLTNSYLLTGTHIQRSMIHTASRINQFVTVKLKEFQFLPFCLGYKNSKDQSSLKLT